ncbi:transcriptional regulator, LytTR family [Ruegeria halocynthiae]|uniref:Transcriptional regulator, LytTR family n=1 Tax=Ruegeria halocynthiae TaxID=985054 RepID=A0A1H2R0H3_9RHOB|nr:LytTR family DNA-binding domain-containing protein [Ruegeria halocynthiae]SDW12845.1 transcriptional regulator, LytTR family [Ruegeria halocynthiae]
MMSKLSPIISICGLQRILAGLVFIPLLAYSFAPFRDVTLPFSQRLLFWAGVMLLAIAATWSAGRLVREWLNLSGLLIRDLAFALLILALFTPSLWLLSWIVFTLNGLMAPGLLMVIPYGLLFATGLLLVRQREDDTEPEGTQRPRLYNRLPATFQGQVCRLTVRDHYVEVVTSEGTFTIRSRFTDAIAEMEPVPGHCTHRSHWVVDAAIVGVAKEGGKPHLCLSNGDQVPVSRKYKQQLVDDGLL